MKPVAIPVSKHTTQYYTTLHYNILHHTTLYSAQSHTLHQDPHLTAPPHHPYIRFISHPALILFPSPQLAELHPTAIPFTSLHFTRHFPTPVLGNTRFPPHFKFPSLHFTSLLFTALHSLHFTALHSLHFTSLPFPSIHFTYPFPNPLPTGARFRRKVPEALTVSQSVSQSVPQLDDPLYSRMSVLRLLVQKFQSRSTLLRQ